MKRSDSSMLFRKNNAEEEKIIESFTDLIKKKYKKENKTIENIDCEYSDYTKEYFGIVSGLKTSRQEFVDIYMYGDNEWKKVKLTKPLSYTKSIDSFIHNYFKFDFETIAIGLTEKLSNNLQNYDEKNNGKSIGNVVIVMKGINSGRKSIELFDYFSSQKYSIYMEVMEPVYCKNFNKDMEER